MPGLLKTGTWGPPHPASTHLCKEGTGQFSGIFCPGMVWGPNVCLDPGQDAEEQ